MSSPADSAATKWEVVTLSTGNTAAFYDTREEAVEAARWAAETFGHQLAVVGFNDKGEAVERDI